MVDRAQHNCRSQVLGEKIPLQSHDVDEYSRILGMAACRGAISPLDRLIDYRWLGLAGPAPDKAAPPLIPLRPGRAALIGLIGGVVSGLMLGRLGRSLPDEWFAGMTTRDAVSVHLQMMLAAIWVQAPLAILAALAVPSLRTIHALFAANVAGLVMAIAIALSLVVRGAPVTLLMTVQYIISPVVIGGTVLALPAALLTELITTFVLSRRLPSLRLRPYR